VDQAVEAPDATEAIAGPPPLGSQFVANLWRRRPRWVGRIKPDLAVAALYLLGGLWLTARLWINVHNRVLSSFAPDQLQFEWWLEHSVRIFTQGENPFFTMKINAPLGVNLVANTATFGMCLPLVPVTLIFGPQVSFAVMTTFAPFATAFCWYLLFSRRIVSSRLAAIVAGGFCGFGPGVAAQDNVHPNLAMQAAVPLIIWQLLRLKDRVSYRRPGVVLALLAIYQFFINEEMLLILALAMAVFTVGWSLYNKAEARAAAPNVAKGLLLGGVISLAVVAYPIWFQFNGPQHYGGFATFAASFGSDLFSFTSFPTHSLAGGAEAVKVADNVVEETTFYGWPLLIMSTIWAAMLWRRFPVIRVAVVTAVIFGLGSLGDHLHILGKSRNIPGPWRLVDHLPILNAVISPRLALVILPIMALLVALVIDQLVTHSNDAAGRWILMFGLAGVAAALLPVVPTPFAAVSRAPVPQFISAKMYKAYVPAGQSILFLPVPMGTVGATASEWTSTPGADFASVGGYFLAPDMRTPEGEAMFGPTPRHTSSLFENLILRNQVPVIGPQDRKEAVADLKFWHTAIVVLAPNEKPNTQLRKIMDDLIGFEPQWVGGVWLWDVRSLVKSG
jgi:hypothetical protein